MSFEETIESIVRKVVREEMGRGASVAAEKWEGCLTLKKAGALVGVSVSTLEKWSREGLRILKRGRVRRVDVAELRAFMAVREPGPKQDARDFARQVLGRTG